MKKLLALLLALVMALSLVACTKGNNDPSSEPPTSEPEQTEDTKAPVDSEAYPENPLVHLDFENTDGLSVVALTNGVLTESAHDILLAEGQGAVGNALYLDGKYGLSFDIPSIEDDTYSISFWYNADRVAVNGPIVQVGRNMDGSNADSPVAWINFTKETWDGDIFPVAWNRNSSIGTEVNADGVWPWMYAMDQMEHGKREWCLLTIVVDGSEGGRYVCVDDGMERVSTRFYLNGELMHEANAENMFYQGLAPEILKGEDTEGFIGANYWDTMFKGFVDELYIFDEVLTAGQVKALFEEGNPPASPVAPSYEWSEPVVEGAPVDPNAIDTLGTPQYELGFWTDTTDGFEVKKGSTVTLKLNNYSDGLANYHNFVLALTNTEVKTDALANAGNYSGYAEYLVLRPDIWGWTPAANPCEDVTYEHTWGDDWAAWLNLMKIAKVDVTVSRSDSEITINYTFTGADGTVMTEKATVPTAKIGIAADSPVYVHLAGEGAYIELLSVE